MPTETINGTLADLVSKEMIEQALACLPDKHGVRPRPPVDLGSLFDGIKIAARIDGMRDRYDAHKKGLLGLASRPAWRPYFDSSAIDKLVQDGTKPLSALPKAAQWDMLFTPSLCLDMMQAYGQGSTKISAIIQIGIYIGGGDTRACLSIPGSTLLAEVRTDPLKNKVSYLGFAYYDKQQNCAVVVSPAYYYASQQTDIEWEKLYATRADRLWQHLNGYNAFPKSLSYLKLGKDPEFRAALAECGFSVNPAKAIDDLQFLLQKIEFIGNSQLAPSGVAIGENSYFLEMAPNSDAMLAGYVESKIWGPVTTWIQNPHLVRFETTLPEGKQGEIVINLGKRE